MEKDPSRRINSAKRALHMLSPHEAALPVAFNSQVDIKTVITPMQKQVNIGRRPPVEMACTTIESGFTRLHVVGVGGEPTLLVESNNDLSILPLLQQKRRRMFPKSGNVLLLGCELLYQVESSINLLNLSSGASRVLHDRCLGAINFAFNGQRLLWRTCRSVHRIDLETRAESSFLLAHYLLEARSLLLPNGCFVVSTGAMNNQIALRSSEGEVKGVHELDGPIVELVNDLDTSGAHSTLLALTLNVKQADSHALWWIPEYSKPQRLDIPTGSRFFTATPGHIFWLIDGTQIIQCGIGLAPRQVFKASEPISGFAISPDHRWLATWINLPGKVSKISFYSTDNCIETLTP